jgi:3',5'-cyclic AMP phosphodiesterase CpdA
LTAAIRFAHLSDWHATTLVGGDRAAFTGKRLSGWVSWALNRRRHHDPAILEAAIRDVQAQQVDRIVVTGDLTHISLPAEFRVARTQLERLGSPEQVFLIPGNHDCYVPVDPSEGWDHWAPYLRSSADGVDAELEALLTPEPALGRAPQHAQFPTLRIAGRVAWIGLCSAIPTPIFRAGGELGAVQRERLRRLLALLGERGYCRVILIHHPVHADGEPERRALWDAAALRALLAEVGAELVVHGHKHRRRVHHLDGPQGKIPTIGVPSSSEVGSRPDRLAQYHVYTIRPAADPAAARFEIEARVRGYDANQRTFVPLPDRLL